MQKKKKITKKTIKVILRLIMIIFLIDKAIEVNNVCWNLLNERRSERDVYLY